MKVIALSDTHMQHEKLVVPEGDVIIHAGDMLNYGNVEELVWFSKWWNKLDFKYKLIVPGNHDWVFQKDEQCARELLAGTEVLIDQEVDVEGLVMYGTPWQPMFNEWAFNLPDHIRASKFQSIPECDVLVCHAPPFGFCDVLPRGEHVGDREMVKVLPRVRKAVVCGHIHHGRGVEEVDEKLTVWNVAICDEGYRPVGNPVEIVL